MASFLGITAEHISRLYKQESLSEKYVDRRLIHAHKEIQRRARKQAFQTAISPLVEFYPIDLTLSRRAANWELFDANSSTYAAGLRDSLGRTPRDLRLLRQQRKIYLCWESQKTKSLDGDEFCPQ